MWLVAILGQLFQLRADLVKTQVTPGLSSSPLYSTSPYKELNKHSSTKSSKPLLFLWVSGYFVSFCLLFPPFFLFLSVLPAHVPTLVRNVTVLMRGFSG